MYEKSQDIVGATEPRPQQNRDAMTKDQQSPLDIALPKPNIAMLMCRIGLSAVGAFLLGVFPGMNWLERYAATSPRMLGAGEQCFMILMLAMTGAVSGIAVIRMISWTKPAKTDAAVVIIVGIVFALIGFRYMLFLVV